MSDDMLRRMRADDLRLRQTETKETPGAAPGFSSFYATGTYTPTYQGSVTGGVTTYSIQQGAWVRVGKVILVTGTLTWTAATGTGDARISLPFTAENVTDQNFSLSLRNTGLTFANGTPQGQILPATNYFTMHSPITNAASAVVVMEAAGTVLFTATYFA